MKRCYNNSCLRSFTGIQKEEGIYCPQCDFYVGIGASMVMPLRNLGRKIGRKKMKKGLIGLLIGSGATTAGFGIHDYITSPKYGRARELDRKVAYIIPRDSSDDNYSIYNQKIKVGVSYLSKESLHLNLHIELLDDNITFFSEPWNLFANGDARNLYKMVINGLTFKKEKINNYDHWQQLYEGLIDKIYIQKIGLEKEAQRTASEKLNLLQDSARH